MPEQPLRQPPAITSRPKPPGQKPPALPMTAPPLGPTPADPLGLGDGAAPATPTRLAKALAAEKFRLPVVCPHCEKSFHYQLCDGGVTVECPHCAGDVILPPFDKQDVIIVQLQCLNESSAQLSDVSRKLNTLITNVTLGVAIAVVMLFLRWAGVL